MVIIIKATLAQAWLCTGKTDTGTPYCKLIQLATIIIYYNTVQTFPEYQCSLKPHPADIQVKNYFYSSFKFNVCLKKKKKKLSESIY